MLLNLEILLSFSNEHNESIGTLEEIVKRFQKIRSQKLATLHGKSTALTHGVKDRVISENDIKKGTPPIKE